jgi:PGM1 C-terminal domain
MMSGACGGACAEEAQPAKLARLQQRLIMADAAARTGGEQRTIVVIPSRTLDRWHEPVPESQAFEERMLTALFELRDPSLRMIYVSSSAIEPAIIDYYLSLLPTRAGRSARRRLSLFALGDYSSRPLSAKLLERPRVLERIRAAISRPELSHLVTYNASRGERHLALALDLPLYGPDPRHDHLGTKSGSRELFAMSGVPHPLGVERITTREQAIRAIARLRAVKPSIAEVVLKLDDGVSGEGNATVDLGGLPEPGAPDEIARIDLRLARLVPAVPYVSPRAFLAKLAGCGGIVEERITGRELRSPSVQFLVSPTGVVELLSTHDQILGGKSGHQYQGCRFPADPAYAPMIAALARRAAYHLAKLGVIGRFAIDFVVARTDEARWEPFALELNLRTGGTTHPYQTLSRLVGGRYDSASASFITAGGQRRHYVASDYLEDERLRALDPDGALAIAQRSGIRFDRRKRVGTVFHMLGPLNELGRAGVTAISDTADRAAALYDHARAALIEEAADSYGPTAPRAAPLLSRASTS